MNFSPKLGKKPPQSAPRLELETAFIALSELRLDFQERKI